VIKAQIKSVNLITASHSRGSSALGEKERRYRVAQESQNIIYGRAVEFLWCAFCSPDAAREKRRKKKERRWAGERASTFGHNFSFIHTMTHCAENKDSFRILYIVCERGCDPGGEKDHRFFFFLAESLFSANRRPAYKNITSRLISKGQFHALSRYARRVSRPHQNTFRPMFSNKRAASLFFYRAFHLILHKNTNETTVFQFSIRGEFLNIERNIFTNYLNETICF